MTGRLAGKVALITGTGGGQGRAGALRFANEGAKIIGCDLNADGAEETVRMVREAGGDMVSLAPLDLAEEDAVQRLIDFATESYGGFDILWNNAGSQRFGTLDTLSVEDFNYTLTNEITILFIAIKHALEVFERRGRGVVINTGSIAADSGTTLPGNVPGILAHNIAKAGVVRLTSTLAAELASRNVRVNCVSPGIIETPGTAPMLGTEDAPGPMRQHFLENLLIRRIGRPDDIVNAVLFLASDESEWMTGSNLIVDGGQSATSGVGLPQANVAAALQSAMASALAASGA